MKKEYIKPSLVLMLICLIACGLLIAAYRKTYVDNTGIITEKLSYGLKDIYGTADGFEIVKSSDGEVLTYDGITSIITDKNNNAAFEITADGYSKGGLHVLVGIDAEGKIKGVSILDISETPGLGTKVQNKAFLEQFNGVDSSMFKPAADTGEKNNSKSKAVWGSKQEYDRIYAENLAAASDTGFEFDAVTGATYSSKGMNRAVTLAALIYNEKKGEIFSE
jgi:electron transport complex protein RnfG